MVVINESYTAKGYTPANEVPAVFGAPRTLDGIVIHHWGEPGQTHQGVVDFFCTTGPGQTSAHFVVSAGRIDCIVSPLDAAWHCPGKNPSTIGIECRPEATDADYAAVAELVAWLRATYGRPLPLSRHRDWYATACPGVWDLARIDQLAGTVTTQSTQEDTLSAAEVQQIKDHINAVLLGGYLWDGKDHPGIVDELRALPGKVWATPVKREGGNVPALQELADAKTGTIQLQAQNAALSNVIQQLAKATGAPVDINAVTAAAEAGAKKALSGLRLVNDNTP